METRYRAGSLLFNLLQIKSPFIATRYPSGICRNCLRTIDSIKPPTRSFRRGLQTITAYRPSHIPTEFAAPRNAETIDSPITEIPSLDNKPPSSIFSKPLIENTSQREETSTSPPKTFRKSRLRPRKAAMTLTPIAITQLRNLLSQPSPKMIRVGVKNRGCSGLAYHLEYVDQPGQFDEVVEQDGVRVLIDSKALFSIIGSEMDWVEDKLNQRFVFRNPNMSKSLSSIYIF